MKNAEIRELMQRKRVRQYEIAAAMGVSESKVSKMLRFELPEQEKQQFIEIINRIVGSGD